MFTAVLNYIGNCNFCFMLFRYSRFLKQNYRILNIFLIFSIHKGRQSNTLQQVKLPIVDQRTCVSKYGALGITVTDDQLCAGGNYGQDTCDGDSGNPLMRVTPEAWVLEGIVSFGRACGLEDWPAVYTRYS